MADAITITIILFVVLNIVGVLFFGGKYDSKLSNPGTSSSYINTVPYDDTYQMSGVNTTSVYNSISPTIQQVRTNIVSKLDQQKARIREHEQQLEVRRQELINKQHQLQTEIDKLDDTIQTSLSDEQIAQINQIKSNLKSKINSIQTQLHGVDAGKVHCVLPRDSVSGNMYRGSNGRRDSRQTRRSLRQPSHSRPRMQENWSRDWSLEDEFTRQPASGDYDAAGVLEEEEQVVSVNECFSDSNPYVNVFGGNGASTFAPFS